LAGKKSVILVGKEGSSRFTTAAFIAKDLFELSARSNLAGTNAVLLNLPAMEHMMRQEGCAATLLSIFDSIAESGHVLTVAAIDYFAAPELSSPDAVNGWAQLLDFARARKVPLLAW